MRIFAILVALIITSKINHTFAQNTNVVLLEKEAESFFKAGKYKSAEAKYLILDSLNPQNLIYSYKLGICSLQKSHKKKALVYLLKAQKNRDICPQDLNYYLGKAFHYNYKFDEAWDSFNQYKNYLVAEHLDNNTMIKDINRKMEICKIAKEIVAKPIAVQISSVGNFVNSSESEYTPVITAD